MGLSHYNNLPAAFFPDAFKFKNYEHYYSTSSSVDSYTLNYNENPSSLIPTSFISPSSDGSMQIVLPPIELKVNSLNENCNKPYYSYMNPLQIDTLSVSTNMNQFNVNSNLFYNHSNTTPLSRSRLSSYNKDINNRETSSYLKHHHGIGNKEIKGYKDKRNSTELHQLSSNKDKPTTYQSNQRGILYKKRHKRRNNTIRKFKCDYHNCTHSYDASNNLNAVSAIEHKLKRIKARGFYRILNN